MLGRKNGERVPAWTLRDSGPGGKRTHTLVVPPGSEGVSWTGGRLAVAFEGGANPYRYCWQVLEDRVLVLETER